MTKRSFKIANFSIGISRWILILFSLSFLYNSIGEYHSAFQIENLSYANSHPVSSAIPTTFISKWDTSKLSYGSSAENQIHLPLISNGSYDFLIHWGDGSSDIISNWDQPEVTHTYAIEGAYSINITGILVGWQFNNTGDRMKLREISQWGMVNLGNGGSYFSGCTNLKLTATDPLNLTGTTTLYCAFMGCSYLGSNGYMNGWDVSMVTNMEHVFNRASTFNQDIGEWNVSRVIKMKAMFYQASNFNQDIGEWNVSRVTDMSIMFYQATAFNQDIGDWNVSRVTDMRVMFSKASNFNQDIGGWNVSRIFSMYGMFYGASAFNQDIGDWDVANVTSMQEMFFLAYNFNQDIGNWDVSNVTSMQNMFTGVTLSINNYNSLLQGWSQLTLQQGVQFQGGFSRCNSEEAATARQYIIDTFEWKISDGHTKNIAKETSTSTTITTTSNSNATQNNTGPQIIIVLVMVVFLGRFGMLTLVLLLINKNSIVQIFKSEGKE